MPKPGPNIAAHLEWLGFARPIGAGAVRAGLESPMNSAPPSTCMALAPRRLPIAGIRTDFSNCRLLSLQMLG